MGFKGEAERAVVVHHMLRERHYWQRDFWLDPRFSRIGMVEQRERNLLRQATHLP